MKVYIRPETNYYHPTLYVLKLIEKNQGIRFDYVKSVGENTALWDHLNSKSQPICLSFYDNLKNKPLSNSIGFDPTIGFQDENGRKDVIAAIFYMVNCMQEFNPGEENVDQYGRFKFQSSYQARFNNIEENLVQNEINFFIKEHQLKATNSESVFFISHDIDSIYGSLKQDGFWALKNMKPGIILSLILNELMGRPHWKNIDKILKINTEYDIRSTFFWLVNQGKGTSNIINADYNIQKEKSSIQLINQSGSFCGLHKSCSEMSIDEEIEKGNLNTVYNRYHFLKFSTHQDWRKISDSKIQLDCSLGFAERYGFRNSYGKSFQPFDLENNQPFNFIEAPLTLMDTTFHTYMKLPINQMGDIIINFCENNSYNCHHSLLWHNNSFTNYKFGPLLREYKKVIKYIYESKIGVITPEMIIKESSLDWDSPK